jgi:hypothetical protein
MSTIIKIDERMKPCTFKFHGNKEMMKNKEHERDDYPHHSILPFFIFIK